MPTPHLLSLAAAFALAFVAPAWGQQEQPMSASLVNQLQDVEVQEQLIALGVLDGTAGQASRSDLRKAVEWFRRAYQSKRGMEPLSDDEKEKLKEAKAKFYATTGLKVPSQVMVDKIIAMPRDKIMRRAGALSPDTLHDVKEALRLWLELA